MEKQIHDNYNESQRKLGMNTLPDWDNLDETYQYANIRAVKGVLGRIRQMGYLCRDANLPPKSGYLCRDANLPPKSGYIEVAAFPEEAIEPLSIQEHDSWMQSRIDDGWVYAPIRDN